MVLSDAHAELLDAVANRLVPRDEHGPGAVEMGATTYVRGLPGHEDDYRTGLEGIDEQARSVHGSGFCRLTTPQQDEVLNRFEVSEPIFFTLLWSHLLEGMFGDPAWGGNADRCGWRMIGYDGPRLVWSAEDQRIEDATAADRTPRTPTPTRP